MADSRLAFDIVARGGSSAAAEFEKVARASDHAGSAMKKNSKISTDAAKASDALTKARAAESNALDKVQVAESKLSNARQTSKDRTSQVQAAEARLLQVRRDANSSTSMIAAAESKLASARSSERNSTTQVLAGEKALSKARREAAAAGNVAQKAAKDLGRVLETEGAKAGKGAARSVSHWFTGGVKDFKAAGQKAAGGFSDGILAGLKGTLATPTIGPIIGVALIAAVEAVAVPTGAILAGGIVTGFGAGIAGLGLVFAAKSAEIKSIWAQTASDLGAQMRTISKPFEMTFAALSVVARRTFATFKPQLAAAFQGLAPALAGFGDHFGSALAKLAPAIKPLSTAFSAVLKSLGPALEQALKGVSAGLQMISQSVAKSPTALGDMVKGAGELTIELLAMLKALNDANGAFQRLTGISGVTALFRGLEVAVALTLGPIVLVAAALGKIADAAKWAWARQFPEQAKAAADQATALAASLHAAAQAHLAHAAAAAHSAHATHEANAAAALLAGAYDRQMAATDKLIGSMNKLSGLLLTLTGAQIDYAQAVADATQAIKDNGHTHDLGSQKGRDNARALLQVAQAAGAQRDAMLRANDGNLSAAKAAETGRAAYVKLATQMGYTKAQAQALAAKFIAFPPVKKVALQANIHDLQTKLATAETALKSPHLTATKKAKLQAEIANLKAGIAAAKALLATLPQSRMARLLVSKADLDAKLAAAKRQLADPHLTATKKAKLEAIIAQLVAQVNAAQAKINSLRGKTVTNSVVTVYSSKGVNLTNPSAVGGDHPLTIPKKSHRAAGGPVTAGHPYLVGEKGPEVWTPKASGTIIPNSALKTGQNVGSGLAQGMLSGGTAAISAAGQVAAQMIAKAKDVLGISSPSKAFAQLGLWVNQGFAIGLKGSAKQVQSVMASLMAKVLNISYNAADTKKSIQNTIANLNAALTKARGRIKPITHGMSSKEVAAAERSNRAVAASIRAIQAKLKTAKIDLANVNSIAARMGTTVKRNAIIGMLQRENAAMQKLANARAVVASQLAAAQTKLADAIQVRDEFKKSITDSALAFNSITNITTDAGRSLVSQDVLAHMRDTLQKTKQFASQLASLKGMGIRDDLYKQIAEAGVESGGATADALLEGGKGAVTAANDLQRQIANASAGLGNTAAKNMYQAGVDAAQGLVNGLLAKTKALDAASKKLAAAIVAQIKKTLGIRSPSKVLQWHGSMAGKGFTKGIEGEYRRVAKAGAGLGAAATNIRSTPGRPGGGGSGQLPLKVELVFKSDGSPHMNWLMGEVRKYVQIKGGDVQKVFGP